MKAVVYDIHGKKASDIILPQQFNESYHPDLIRRAVLSILAGRRQKYGVSPEGGKRHAVYLSKRRRNYKGSYGHGMSRTPRKTMWRRGTQFGWEGAFAPGTKGGRRAHPPKMEKDFTLKINLNEKRKAVRSALSATVDRNLVEQRGHKIGTLYPIILESKAETLAKTRDVKSLLEALGLKEEMERNRETKIRAGRGKLRGRKHAKKRGLLFVVSSKCSLFKSASNIPGVEVAEARELNAELLAPGTNAGRLTIYTDKAIAEMDSKNLFLNKQKKIKAVKEKVKEKKAGKKKSPAEKSPVKTAKKMPAKKQGKAGSKE
jgi:large subunit ribosomal protein L4e